MDDIRCIYITLYLVSILWTAAAHDATTLSRKLRSIVYPKDATMGIFLALAIPIELPGRSISLSYNYEANYKLPWNATMFSDPAAWREGGGERRTKRSLNRRRAYRILEKRLESKGLNGRECLLRTICEAAETPLGHNGLTGDLMHILFTPSSSSSEKLHPSFSDAETMGLEGGDCRLEYPKCPQGLFDFISTLD